MASHARTRHPPTERGGSMATFIDIDGVSTWTETRGSGERTLVLLHGGLGNSDDLLDSIGAADLVGELPGRRLRPSRPRLHRRHRRAVPLRRHGHARHQGARAPRHVIEGPPRRMERRRHRGDARRASPARPRRPARAHRHELPLRGHPRAGSGRRCTAPGDARGLREAFTRRCRPLSRSWPRSSWPWSPPSRR